MVQWRNHDFLPSFQLHDAPNPQREVASEKILLQNNSLPLLYSVHFLFRILTQTKPYYIKCTNQEINLDDSSKKKYQKLFRLTIKGEIEDRKDTCRRKCSWLKNVRE